VHLVTINPDGSPQVSVVWVGLDGDEIVSGHLPYHRKLRNIERDPRVSMSIEAPTLNRIGLREYLVVHGRGRVEAKTACRARGANEAVAALPRPQQLGADAGALTQLADPEGSVAGHPKIIQQLDSFLTELRPTATVRT